MERCVKGREIEIRTKKEKNGISEIEKRRQERDRVES